MDPGTLLAALVVVCAAIAGALTLTWLRYRGAPGLGLWIACFAAFAASAAFALARGTISESLAVDAAGTLRLFGLGLAWQATRYGVGKKGSWLVALAPPVIWVAASLSFLGDDYRLRALVALPLIAASALMVAVELWRAPSHAFLKIARPAAIFLVIHALFMAARFVAVVTTEGFDLHEGIGAPLHPLALLEAFVVAIVLAFMLIVAAMERTLDRYRHAALVDPLTGVSNRRGFEAEVERMLARARRAGTSTGLLLLDLDHFKRVNDSRGHPAGDRALQAFTKVAAAQLRGGDLLARLGGEEFAVAMADCGAGDAMRLAERIRRAVASLLVRDDDGDISMTVSIGVVSQRGAESLDALMHEADSALYRAKTAGRNRVETASEHDLGAAAADLTEIAGKMRRAEGRPEERRSKGSAAARA